MKVPFAGKKVRVTGKYYPEFRYEGYLVPGPCLDWGFSQVPTHHLRVTHALVFCTTREQSNHHKPVFTTDRIEVIQ